jgi:hypothetical protein
MKMGAHLHGAITTVGHSYLGYRPASIELNAAGFGE